MNEMPAYDPEIILADIGLAARIEAPLEEGHSGTPVWTIKTAAGERATLRVFEERERHMVDRLVTIHRTVGDTIPVPEVLAAEMWQGHPVLVLSWITGTTLQKVIYSNPSCAADLGRQFGQIQARLNSIRIPRRFPISTVRPPAI
ncbi:MAG: hypothetical protein QGI68_10170 [Pseudomonadales bacterium]|nr:hypothetical protein [Pseudomonadales bacterium]MDP7357332.1 hypothetical protein [Pseudomonadales bacterium]MDP7595919.1 hypothetical protein [Pseudomonadales bacterium]HJN49294.1 hypothetical protein [Pseudomonadales bacterium]